MKTQSNRVRKKVSITRMTSQVQAPLAPPVNGVRPQMDAPESVQPCEVEDSLNHLRRDGKAAASLCVLNAYSIKCALQDGVDGMGLFNSSTFGDGNLELAQNLENEFYLCLTEWEKDQRGVLEGELYKVRARVNIDISIRSLVHLLELQGQFLTNHADKDEDSGAMDCCITAIESLQASLSESHCISGKLRKLGYYDNKRTTFKKAA